MMSRNPQDRQMVYDFISNHKLAVVSTTNSTGQPQSAVVGFGQTEDLQLIFGTYSSSRKYRNLQQRPDVSVVIGWDDGATVQYEGTARELSGAEAERYSEMYFAKSPDARQYKDHPEERYFLVTPKWVRYTDLSVDPWDIVELRF